MSEAPVALSAGWYVESVTPGVDPLRPGLYEWRIEGLGVYVGQYTRASRPRPEYGRNVANILNVRPYRKGKPDRFRAIHLTLAEAVRSGRPVNLTFLENVPLKLDRNRREREVIAERREAASEGGPRVLNSGQHRN